MAAIQDLHQRRQERWLLLRRRRRSHGGSLRIDVIVDNGPLVVAVAALPAPRLGEEATLPSTRLGLRSLRGLNSLGAAVAEAAAVMRAMGERLLAVGPSSSVRFLRLRFLGSPCVAVDASSSASNGSPLVEEELVLLVVLLLRCLGVAPSFHLSIASAPASSFVPLLLLFGMLLSG